MSKRSTEADQGAGGAEGKRTEVFISATSGDLRTVREMVKQGLLTMGCFPIEQTNFEPDYRTVRQNAVRHQIPGSHRMAQSAIFAFRIPPFQNPPPTPCKPTSNQSLAFISKSPQLSLSVAEAQAARPK